MMEMMTSAAPRTSETLAFSPSLGRSAALGFGLAFLIGLLVLLLVKMPPVIEIILITTVAATVALRLLLRLTLVRFDETENGPWFVRATTSWLGLPLASRVAPRSQIEIANKYRESGMTSSGTGYAEKYWSEVALTNGQPFFSRWEVWVFGHRKLVRLMEQFL